MFLISICAISSLALVLLSRQKYIDCAGDGIGFGGQFRLATTKHVTFLFAMILILTSTVRHGFIDTYAYKIMYTSARDNLLYVNSAPWGVEAGWLYFLYLLNYISADPKLMLFISALIINLGYIILCKRYSADVNWSLLIYFCLCYMDTNNGLRQYVAAGIMMLLFPMLKQKKYIYYLLGILLAYQFHESAIVCVFIAIVIVGKVMNMKTILALLFGVMFLIIPSWGNMIIGDMFDDSKYLFYLEFSEGMGMGVLRALITGIIPCVLAIMYLVRCKKSKTKVVGTEAMLLNMLFINTMFIVMGLYMQYWARFAFYTSFAPIVLMPKLVYGVLGKHNYKLVKVFAVMCYLFFFAYNIYVNIAYGAMADFYIDI